MYNRSEIMRNAWVSFKFAKANGGKLGFGHFLRASWAKAKAHANVDKIASAKVKFENGMALEVSGYEFILNRWKKNGMDRIYLNGGRRDGYGYIDLVTGAYHPKTNFDPAKSAAKIVSTMIFN